MTAPIVQFTDGPIIFARIGSPALEVMQKFAGNMVPGAIFSVSQKDLDSLKNPDDMFVLWRSK
jgi:hypothetical protein